MRGSWQIARIAGIDLSLHWTFGLLLGWVLFSSGSGAGVLRGLVEVLFVLTLFGCVVLHELGHAMAARVFGVPTHGITLLPIGGVAHLDRIPRDPWQEWVIALAGPAVNVMIVGLLFPISALLQGASGWPWPLGTGEHLLVRLMWVNVMLVAFNLLPAFPMDGGRLLRSWLAARTDYATATRRAKRFGQAVAVLLALWGLWTNLILLLIAAFVFIAAETEYRTVLKDAARDIPEPSLERRRQEAVRRTVLPGLEGHDLPVGSTPYGVHPGNSAGRGPAACHQILPGGVVIVRTFPVAEEAS